MSYYIGVAKCCGNVTAALVHDERTTPREVKDFIDGLLTRDRELRFVGTLDGLKIARCKCNEVTR